ncbi:unnamed protein product [Phytophthora fragariaefolia]|uniref:RxLR effector protein n=1 Tax=Phytophthora fragariaefolia TaxID=1490495 RepID=A0A9W6YN42_9STRA|nr:unnamed protein product [Phytophthora fragariaefolia]
MVLTARGPYEEELNWINYLADEHNFMLEYTKHISAESGPRCETIRASITMHGTCTLQERIPLGTRFAAVELYIDAAPPPYDGRKIGKPHTLNGDNQCSFANYPVLIKSFETCKKLSMRVHWLIVLVAAFVAVDTDASATGVALENNAKLPSISAQEDLQEVGFSETKANGRRFLRTPQKINDREDEDDNNKEKEEEDRFYTFLVNKLGTVVGQFKHAEKLKAQAQLGGQQVKEATKLTKTHVSETTLEKFLKRVNQNADK